MPRQGGQGKGKPGLHDKHFGSDSLKFYLGNNSISVGKALIRRHAIGKQGNEVRKLGGDRPKLVSHLETSALEDYVAVFEMEGREAEVHRVHQHDAFLVDSKSSRNLQSMKYALTLEYFFSLY